MSVTEPFLSAFFAIPAGSSTGRVCGRRYIVNRTELAGGKSHKLVAHELGSGDYISLNLYLTRNSGALLRPCEMSVQKVTDFVLGFEPDP
ncbi:hypothetical protein [Ruegeria sp. Ofav3-42]|uniref:hypothetical protein n=1 Tax=Ruegeria sp. Ofav3-42 TaxID=2917759 RepID=UPI001EF4A54B|nr:hypothetical protein [Ruegeria sp. Ofav3-42]MCG7520255.1 hypothetical protein [Ruegeria sp. Ofav3-42]